MQTLHDFTYFGSDIGRLQERGGPSPLRHDGRGGQPDGDVTAGVERRIQVVFIFVEIPTNPAEQLSNEGGKNTEAKDEEDAFPLGNLWN